MAWWVVAVRNFSAVAKNSLGGFCVLFRCRMNLDLIPTYVLRQGAPSCTGLYVEINRNFNTGKGI